MFNNVTSNSVRKLIKKFTKSLELFFGVKAGSDKNSKENFFRQQVGMRKACRESNPQITIWKLYINLIQPRLIGNLLDTFLNIKDDTGARRWGRYSERKREREGERWGERETDGEDKNWVHKAKELEKKTGNNKRIEKK